MAGNVERWTKICSKGLLPRHEAAGGVWKYHGDDDDDDDDDDDEDDDDDDDDDGDGDGFFLAIISVSKYWLWSGWF